MYWYYFAGAKTTFVFNYRSYRSVVKSIEKGSNRFLAGRRATEKQFLFVRSVLGYAYANITALTLVAIFRRRALFLDFDRFIDDSSYRCVKLSRITAAVSCERLLIEGAAIEVPAKHMLGGNRYLTADLSAVGLSLSPPTRTCPRILMPLFACVYTLVRLFDV